MKILRQQLSGGWQAWYDPPTNVLLIDPTVWDQREQVIREIQHELLGNHHLAPHVDHPRPQLRLVTDQCDDRGVG